MRALETGTKLRAYTLEHRIGRGAEGDVWFARNMRGDPIALKARVNTDDKDAQRFRAEFARLRTLRIPGVVHVLDAGADQGYLFFTMEVAAGVPFSQFVATLTDPTNRMESVCRAGAQVARALASIHRLGLAHRDIKPANIHVTGTGEHIEAVVLDFGTHHFGHVQDQTGAMRGTPAYMSPEQRLGMPHDHRVDLYSLGTVLYEALMDTPARKLQPGQRCPSIVGAGPHIPLPLADLVDRMLDLDPADRPTAEEAEAVLRSIAMKVRLPLAAWPKPVFTEDNIDALLESSRLVVGGLGDGVGRLIASARGAWYRKGYPSIMGRCDPSKPYGPWMTILSELFQQRTVSQRTELAGSDVDVLHGIWPEMPIPSAKPYVSVPDEIAAGQAIANVLNRCSPIAIILHQIDDADVGTVESLPLVMASLDSRSRIWTTARQPVTGIRTLNPPPWNETSHKNAWDELIGDRFPMPDTSQTGKAFLKSVWTRLARERGHPPLPSPIPPSLARLSVLSEPFPHAVAVQVAPDLDTWIEGNLIEVVSAATANASARLRFSSGAIRELALSELDNRKEAHRLAAMAWERFPEADEAIRRRTIHLLRAKVATPDDIKAVVRLEVDRERPLHIRRWMDLLWLHLDANQTDNTRGDFEIRYAQLLSQLHIAPNTIELSDVRELSVQAQNPIQRGLAAHLKLAHAIRADTAQTILDDARRWARSFSQTHPVLAARLYREIALADLRAGRDDEGMAASRNALFLSRKGSNWDEDETTAIDTTIPVQPMRLTQPEIDAATTYSAALVYAGRPLEALDLCETMANRCQQMGRQRGQAAFLINGAIAALQTGRRTRAINEVAQAAALQHTHGDSAVFANLAVTSARLAVERADLAASPLLIDEAVTAAQGLGDPDLLGEAWSVALDKAALTGHVPEARRALMAYGEKEAWSSRDHFPAALARWQWTRGSLENALLATDEPRQGFGGACVQAERCRLLLLNGNVDACVATSKALLRSASKHGWDDLQKFSELVLGAAERVDDSTYQPLIAASRHSRWVHLYLGALHLDAIRRRGRGENVMPQLRTLRSRASDLGHLMYEALANPKGW